MLTLQRQLVGESTALNVRVDNFVRNYNGYRGAMPKELSNQFGKDLWENFKALAKFVQETETGKYSDNIFDTRMIKLIDDVRHQVFLTFSRLSKLGLVRDDGPCPMCFQSCNKDNPRATSHIIADAAFRVMISHSDSRMDGSLQVRDGDHVIGRMKGPSSIKWKMLCRKCENFVSNSGESQLTELLKAFVPATNERFVVENAQWRSTIAATLLWRTMHVAVDLKTNSDEMALMYPLYDELMMGMKQARSALARGVEISSVYPSIAIHVSPYGLEHEGLDNRASHFDIFFCGQEGYVNVNIWTFHFIGFFNRCSKESMFHDGVAGSSDNTWTIPAGAARRSPQLVLKEKIVSINSRAAVRSDPSNHDRDAHYQRYFTLNGENMTTIKDQPSLPPDENFHELLQVIQLDGQIGLLVRYYPISNLVHYIERFDCDDVYFKGGFNIVFGVTADGDFTATDVSIRLLLLEQIDPEQRIRKNCVAVSMDNLANGVSGVKL